MKKREKKSPNLLFLDTSTTVCSIGLQLGDKIETFTKEGLKEQSQFLLTMIADLLKTHNLQLSQLDAIAVGHGPGSFTGVRLAISVVQGLAYAVQLPVIAFSSLRVLAQSAYRRFKPTEVVVAQDAYADEIYWGIYSLDEEGVMRAVDSDQLTGASLVKFSSSCFCVGNAWEKYQYKLRRQLNDIEPSHLLGEIKVDPVAGLELATVAYKKNEIIALEALTPVYLRGQGAWETISRY